MDYLCFEIGKFHVVDDDIQIKIERPDSHYRAYFKIGKSSWTTAGEDILGRLNLNFFTQYENKLNASQRAAAHNNTTENTREWLTIVSVVVKEMLRTKGIVDFSRYIDLAGNAHFRDTEMRRAMSTEVVRYFKQPVAQSQSEEE